MDLRLLKVNPITVANFAPFGWLASGEGMEHAQTRRINEGSSLRLDGTGELSLSADGGQPCLALFRAQARDLTQACTVLERHRLGTQTFVPLGGVRYVMLVATGEEAPDAASLAAFLVEGHQAITLRADTWHHGLMALEAGDFIVVERVADEVDCELAILSAPVYLRLEG